MDDSVKREALGMRTTVGIVLSVTLLLSGLQPAVAHEVDPEDAGHPVRIAAYVLHPLGYGLLKGVVEPIHRILSNPRPSRVFGHKEDPFDQPLRQPASYKPVLEIQPLVDLSSETGEAEEVEEPVAPPDEIAPLLEEIREEEMPRYPVHSIQPRYNFVPRGDDIDYEPDETEIE